AELLVTQPRLPCYKLGIRFGRADMVKRFLASGRTGFYFAVLREGEVGAGDAIELVARDALGVSIAEVTRLYVGEHPDDEALGRGRAPRDHRPRGPALLRAGALERARPHPEGAPLRPDGPRGQPRRGREGVLLLPRRDAHALVPEGALQVSPARIPLHLAGRGEPPPREARRRVRAGRHRRLRRRPLLRRHRRVRQ